MRRGRMAVGAAGFLAAFLLPAGASPAAVTIGSNLNAAPDVGSGYCPSGMGQCTATNLSLPQNSVAADGLTAPFDGVVVSWRVRSGSSGNAVALRVLRPGGGTTYTGAGTSSSQTTAGGFESFETQLPIRAGDGVGLNIGNQGVLFAQTPNASVVLWGITNMFPNGLPDGTTAAGDPGAPLELLVQAVVEPDCDEDGLGDESQDPSVDCIDPDTTITGRPDEVVKSKKKRVSVTYGFSSSEPASSFQCQLDGGPFQPCTTPFSTKVSAGKPPIQHSFGVRAIDAAGNVDQTPATDDFEAKRKKKKK